VTVPDNEAFPSTLTMSISLLTGATRNWRIPLKYTSVELSVVNSVPNKKMLVNSPIFGAPGQTPVRFRPDTGEPNICVLVVESLGVVTVTGPNRLEVTDGIRTISISVDTGATWN